MYRWCHSKTELFLLAIFVIFQLCQGTKRDRCKFIITNIFLVLNKSSKFGVVRTQCFDILTKSRKFASYLLDFVTQIVAVLKI